MLVDARSVEEGSLLRTGICIIGAGAAGITLAREFARSKLTVMLLESGGFRRDSKIQKLYKGECRGPILDAHPSYPSSSRVRYFGGTTNHWAGWCRPLDPLDFEERPWVPNSGWPITRSDLNPYYTRALDVIQIDPFDDDPHERLAGESTLGDQYMDSPIVTRLFHFSPPTRFGETYRQELIDSPTTTVMIHANVLDIRSNADASRVEHLEVARLDGTRFTVESRYVVLAAGGIENARLLLSSDGVQRNGLGNERGLVGRFFSDHPHLIAGHVAITDPAPSMKTYGLGSKNRRRIAVLSLTEAVQLTKSRVRSEAWRRASIISK
jgi:choline dehydrogenase-like flavoprotein